MLINHDELARKVLEGELTSLDDRNSVLRSMIKDVAEAAMGAEMTAFLGYDRYPTPASDAGNRRTRYSQKELASKVGPIVIDVPRDRKSEFAPAIVKKRPDCHPDRSHPPASHTRPADATCRLIFSAHTPENARKSILTRSSGIASDTPMQKRKAPTAQAGASNITLFKKTYGLTIAPQLWT